MTREINRNYSFQAFVIQFLAFPRDLPHVRSKFEENMEVREVT